MHFSIDNVTPDGQVALLYARAQGSFVIPNGYPCAGTVLGLDSTVALGTTITADPNGLATLITSVPPGACGLFHFQALDLNDCRTSTSCCFSNEARLHRDTTLVQVDSTGMFRTMAWSLFIVSM